MLDNRGDVLFVLGGNLQHEASCMSWHVMILCKALSLCSEQVIPKYIRAHARGGHWRMQGMCCSAVADSAFPNRDSGPLAAGSTT
jgi:hypothetical protein